MTPPFSACMQMSPPFSPVRTSALKIAAVVDHEHPGIGHEQLERADPVANERVHLAQDPVAHVAHDHVQAVVDDGLALGLPPPLVARRGERAAHRLHRKVDDRRRPAEGRGAGPGLKVIRRKRPAERQLHVGVDIDATGDDELAGRVDLLRAAGGEASSDLRDLLAVHEHVGFIRIGRGHDGPAGDEGLAHSVLPTRRWHTVSRPRGASLLGSPCRRQIPGAEASAKVSRVMVRREVDEVGRLQQLLGHERIPEDPPQPLAVITARMRIESPSQWRAMQAHARTTLPGP